MPRCYISGEFAGYRLKKPLPIKISHDEDGHIWLENQELELISCGESFREALEHLEAVFRTVVEEYLLSSELMSEGAEKLKEKLSQFVEVDKYVIRLRD